MYLNKQEKLLTQDYLNNGFIIKPVADKEAFSKIKNFVLKSILKHKIYTSSNFKSKNLFNDTHKFLKQLEINDFRIDMIKDVYSFPDIKKLYYLLAKPYLDVLAGNELAMQKRLSLSIQMPEDQSSLLPVHTDTWSGDSPYEIVVWLPLVDCFNSKSMYILPPKHYDFFKKILTNPKYNNSQKIFNAIKGKIKWIKIKEGEVLIFNQNLPHGNIVNSEKETRWSFNCRFKSLFSPYSKKDLGEFFEPIIIRAATQQGIKYKIN